MSGWAQREAERKEDEANEMDELITEVRELHTRLSAIIAERDALRAELARLQAKLSAAEDAEDVKNGAINNLTADNARLREALELGECYMKVFRHEIARNNATFEGSEDQAEVDGDLAKVQSALAATPAQSLAAHDAAVKVAVLRDVADREFDPEQSSEERWAYGVLHGNADRIAKEAANG